jgi:GT2 family glycosyltransferase
MSSCTIVVLTYKGRHHLQWLLPTLQTAIDNYQGDAKIDVHIVDNGSDELTKKFSESSFPNFKYSFSPVNDYLFSLNSFVEQSQSDFTFILNDDMKVDKNVLNEVIPIMEKDNCLFAVTCRILDWDGGCTLSAVRAAKYDKGWMYDYYLDHQESDTKYTLYPGGGAAIFRTDYFNSLNGFDTLYRPAYCEDADLGIRAWQNNWKVIYHPKAILFHREGGTINDQFKRDRIEQTIYKNHILWMLKNVRYPGFLFWFILLLPYRLIYNSRYNKNQFKALVQSFKQMGKAISKRNYSSILVSDEEWIKMLDKEYSY